jgi:RNA polymerase sigma-70 factor, ECF subfamily
LTALAEADLVRRIAAGSEEAFAVLYEECSAAVFRFALAMSGSREAAEEVTQETFLIFMRSWRDFDSSRGRLISWLLGIARNLVRRNAEPARENELLDETVEPMAPCDLHAEFTRRETIETVRQAVLALPSPYREVIVLCELEEVDYREAAAILECPVGTVRSRLHRARNLLISKLQTRCFV